MKLTKGVLIGQVVFLAALAGVVVTQVKGGGGGKKHDPAADPTHQVAATTEEHRDAGHGEKPAPAHGDKGAAQHGGEHGEKKHGPSHQAGAPGPHGLGEDPKVIARELLQGNGRFAAGQRTGYDLSAQREAAAAGQHPSAMILGCADSRVPPELIFDRGLGELFVVRSAGNIAEPVAVGSLEYAAEHLHSKVIVILGHDKCGAVQAALANTKMPSDNLEAVVRYITPGLRSLKGWADGADLVRLAVEANVRRQGEELLRRSPLLRKAVAKNEIIILRAVYDIETGHVRPL